MSELLGKTVGIEIECVSREGSALDRFETSGTIEEATDARIGVRREGFSELFGLPPVPDLLETDPDGRFDYALTLTVTVSDPESLLEIRGVGFVQ
jgi:hypothetical protein